MSDDPLDRLEAETRKDTEAEPALKDAVLNVAACLTLALLAAVVMSLGVWALVEIWEAILS